MSDGRLDLEARSAAEIADLQGRLLALVSASSAIFHSPKLDDVQAATIATARELVTADVYALWHIDPASGNWHVARSDGISKEFSSRVLSADFVETSRHVPFGGPLAMEDVLTDPRLRGQQDAYRSEGIRSMLVLPLTIAGVRSSTLVFYYRAPHRPTPVEAQTGQALANLAAAAISIANWYGASEYASQQAAFLAKAGALFASSLDYEKTLAAVADLAVPYVADWCAVDIVDEAGQVTRLAVAHVDPSKLELARGLHKRYPEDPNAAGGIRQVIRTGQPTLVAAIPREMLVAAARDVDHVRLIDSLGLTSYMCVPLVARGHILGAVTLAAAESGRHYTSADLRFAQDLAGRAAMAIDNARMFQQASDANRLKDDFLATLSHELRTPLNAVLGYAKMLGMNMLDASKQAQAVSVIERNAQSLRQIIEDVLDVSRIVSGKLRLNVQPVNASDVVKLAIATILPAADAKHLRLQSVLDPQAPPVSGDPDRLQQVVWNLLSNAVKFTPKGGRIQIKVQQIHSHVEIVISDTGRGITPEFIPHLFERFRQADSAFSRDHGGLGLGLAIVRELVELHGGTVHASSDGPGTGATFTVALPLMIVHPVPRPAAARVHPRAEPAGEPPMRHRLDGVKVLAVDDEDDALGLMREILESAGAEVWTADSAARALDLLAQRLPDAIIADVGMPGMDGFELIREIRRGRVPGAQNIRAAALTAYARGRDRISALASGFQMHVAKPVDPAELIVTVAALANRPSLHD